uniref:Uncharacterized protein n=1 Tax=Romanomermis culicivorax TaxID=13658 RepID=A0A915KQ42_ROMCU
MGSAGGGSRAVIRTSYDGDFDFSVAPFIQFFFILSNWKDFTANQATNATSEKGEDAGDERHGRSQKVWVAFLNLSFVNQTFSLEKTIKNKKSTYKNYIICKKNERQRRKMKYIINETRTKEEQRLLTLKYNKRLV